MMEFSELGLHQSLQKALDKLTFTKPTDVQAQTIPAVLAGKDIMVSAKTGSGKTAAFLLPMLHKFLNDPRPNTSTRALILLPTRELALQTVKAFEQFAGYTQIKVGLIMGGEAYKHQVATVRKNPEVLVATPGRLVEHIKNGNVDFSDLEFLVLDESDRMLDMGFQENMLAIAAVCNEERQNLLFSATLKHKGIGGITGLLQDPVRIQVDSAKEGHSNITQQRVFADDDSHKEKLVVKLIAEEDAQRVIVFCNTRLQCQKVSNILRANKLVSEYIHGEVTQSDRKQVMNRFIDGKIRVLVATDVAARGLDIKDVDLVINFSAAFTGDEHVHRVGRTGRSDKTGLAITLISPKEFNPMSSIERYLKIRLIPRKVKGLEGTYNGPKKLKSSGKAAGPKKKKTKTAAGKASKKLPSKKDPQKKRSAPKVNLGDGSEPLFKR
ncbi:DEAD/DEAH box helicase [Saccharophagus degradans]|uniref:DEAD/DEAH box helicase n=1 Tax=Saccharophagus degradans TaxID=86304 RepID=A0AAW7XBU4_9GAMM|nr:DEAD/DEAH box helicase [Saccharophagus degradans]MDO6423897.1 DEAD/DEAH box helicase [Saccharophagus degradans]MDO6607974.1 DEAD/DEAH box helicase [Saccharophagus degradans]